MNIKHRESDGNGPDRYNTKKILKIVLFLHGCLGILRFGGTPKKIPRHTSPSRNTGWETLL